MDSNQGDVGPTREKEDDEKAVAAAVEDVPDPDEDDLDDLDDMLDDFSSLKVDSKEPVAAAPGPQGPVAATAPSAAAEETAAEGVPSEDDFAKQFEAEMANLLGEIGQSPEMQTQFETLFRELGGAAAAGEIPAADTVSRDAAAPSSSAGGDGANTSSFQDTIRQTMERMQASGEQATAAAAAEGPDDFMAELLKQMQAGGLEGGAGGEGGEEELSKMLLGMMEQLTNKDILYEPMKELNDKFPEWLDKNRDTVAQEDLTRYEEQQALVKEIVGRFEMPTYSDSNTADREYIVDKMQKMQAAGSPPPDLVGDMPSAQDALNMPDESCNMQ